MRLHKRVRFIYVQFDMLICGTDQVKDAQVLPILNSLAFSRTWEQKSVQYLGWCWNAIVTCY